MRQFIVFDEQGIVDEVKKVLLSSVTNRSHKIIKILIYDLIDNKHAFISHIKYIQRKSADIYNKLKT